MQELLLGLAQEVPKLLFLLISRCYLPHPVSDGESSTPSSSLANGKTSLASASHDCGGHLLETLQLLDSEDGTHLLVRQMNKKHSLADLCVEAMKTVKALPFTDQSLWEYHHLWYTSLQVS